MSLLPETLQLPVQEDAELAVVSAMLMEPGVIPEVRAALVPDAFSDQIHRASFVALCEMDEAGEGEQIDPLALAAKLGKDEWVKPYVGALIDAIPTAANALYHARLVREAHEARVLIKGLERASRALRNGTMDAKKAAASVADLTLGVAAANSSSTGGFRPAKAIVRDLMGEFTAREKALKEGGFAGTPSGFWEIDELTGGYAPGELIVMAGVPGSGKTALAFQIALNNALASPARGVGFVSAEMTAMALLERGVSNIARIPTPKLRRMDLHDDDYPRLTRATGVLAGAPLYVDETPCPNVREVMARCRALKTKHPEIGLIVVDFLQLLTGDDDNRAEELRGIAYQLKGLAKLLGVPIIACCQLNDKEIEKRPDKHPQLADLQGSSGMRQAADMIALCYRPIMYNAFADDVLEVQWAKMRGLPVTTTTLTADLQYMRIVSGAREARTDPKRGELIARGTSWTHN